MVLNVLALDVGLLSLGTVQLVLDAEQILIDVMVPGLFPFDALMLVVEVFLLFDVLVLALHVIALVVGLFLLVLFLHAKVVVLGLFPFVLLLPVRVLVLGLVLFLPVKVLVLIFLLLVTVLLCPASLISFMCRMTVDEIDFLVVCLFFVFLIFGFLLVQVCVSFLYPTSFLPRCSAGILFVIFSCFVVVSPSWFQLCQLRTWFMCILLGSFDVSSFLTCFLFLGYDSEVAASTILALRLAVTYSYFLFLLFSELPLLSFVFFLTLVGPILLPDSLSSSFCLILSCFQLLLLTEPLSCSFVLSLPGFLLLSVLSHCHGLGSYFNWFPTHIVREINFVILCTTSNSILYSGYL